MRIVFAGTPEPAVPSLRRLLEHPGHEVVAVITRPDAPRGRGKRLHPSPVREVADAAGVPVLTPASLRDAETADALRELAPDCVAVVAYGNLVPPELLALPEHGWVNLHFSLLPAWRGAAPVQAALAAGDEITGATTFRIEEGLDTGPVLGTVTEAVRDDDTAGDLLDRLAVSGAHLLAATMDGLAAGRLRPEPQPDEGVSHAAKITPGDARVDWTLPAHVIDRQVRAHLPHPGPWTMLDGARLKLGRVVPLADDDPLAAEPLAPGHVRRRKGRVVVGTGSVPVDLTEVQAPGKRMMRAGDWANGANPDGKVVE